MFGFIFRSLLGSSNDRQIKRFNGLVAQINALESTMENKTAEEFKALTDSLRERVQNKGETLDSILPIAFAAVREASKRTLGLRHYDVQLMGGICLHQGFIAEMATGEGKTLVATLAAYLNALTGQGVHVVTVNDYLAERDANWMRSIYEFLGMSVSALVANLAPDQRQAIYATDITYGTNNEFGFDYLRDHMVTHVDQKVQIKPLYFAVVDEVDSILIDEARTPLIISGEVNEDPRIYQLFNQLVSQFLQQTYSDVVPSIMNDYETPEEIGDFMLDEAGNQIYLTDKGHEKLEQLLIERELLSVDENLYSPKNGRLVHHMQCALKAHYLYKNDVHYLVHESEVIIIDLHTGRAMPGRRWSEGIHQAVEAKEGVPIKKENRTLASTTFQNYFRLYKKLSGMTGTADTEAVEFNEIYGLKVIVVPAHKTIARVDYNDVIYRSKEEKRMALLKEVQACVKQGQPVLIGTASVEDSELLSKLFKKENVKHSLLNAKHHEAEAEVVAQAGKSGMITIATNMAGRGTDIVLGGSWQDQIKALDAEKDKSKIESIKAQWKIDHEKVKEAGGLMVIGAERNESRRIDNQLRGRSGRQGDIGASRFYLSLEDDLIRIFTPERIRDMMARMGFETNEPIEHRLISRSIERAQRKVEGSHFEVRKQLLEYDDIISEQRKTIYRYRDSILEADAFFDKTFGIFQAMTDKIIKRFWHDRLSAEDVDWQSMETEIQNHFNHALLLHRESDTPQIADSNALQVILDQYFSDHMKQLEEALGDSFEDFQKSLLLQVLDRHWQIHLTSLDSLRSNVHLRSYAQKNPKHEFKQESFQLFKHLIDDSYMEYIRYLSFMVLGSRDNNTQSLQDAMPEKAITQLKTNENYIKNNTSSIEDEANSIKGSIGRPRNLRSQRPVPKTETIRRDVEKLGRNDPCYCGSGKKYKQCHGKH